MHAPRCRAVGGRLIGLCLVVAVAAGCTRTFFRERADQQVDELLAEKTGDPRWPLENWQAYPDERARFADFSKPDKPSKPPDDPAAAALSPDPQRLRGHLHSGPRQEGSGYLDFLAACDQANRSLLAEAEAEKPPATLGVPGKPAAFVAASGVGGQEATESLDAALRTDEPRFLITLEQALELSLFNSRDYQDRREDLYLAALPVTLQRFAFVTQFFAGVNAAQTNLGGENAGGGTARSINTNVSASTLFPSGATAVLGLANRLAIDLSTGSPTIGLSTLTLDLVQPLLRGGGWAVTLEPLTQAERTLVYGVRSYARFRKNYFVFVAGGADQNNGALGYAGLNEGNPGPSLGTPSQGYLPTILSFAQERNERENIRALTGYLALYREFQGRGDFSELQVGQVEQQILRGQQSLLARRQELQNGLDGFKLQLGVPTTLPLELEESPTRPVRDMLGEFTKARDEFQALRGEADQARTSLRNPLQALAGSAVSVVTIDAELRRAVERLVFDSTLSRSTKDFKARIPGRWARWKELTSPQIRAAIKVLSDELRGLQLEEAKYEARNEPLPKEQADRLAALPRDIAVGQLELAIRDYEASRGKTDTTPRGSALLYEEAVNAFIRVMSEARAERRAIIRESWPKLPNVDVDGTDLLTADLDIAQAVAAQVALAERLDLMNARAATVDAWRRIAVTANSLLGVLNVGYNFTGASPPDANRPFAIGGSRGSSSLILNAELPLVRRAERNAYRTSLIAYQRSRRFLQAAEDTVLNEVRADLRNLRVLAENYKIQQRAVEVAYDQVENSLDVLQAPPVPDAAPAQPGRAAAQGQQQAANAASLTQQLLGAQTSLLAAQNGLYTVYVNYLIARMTFFRDIERLPLDPRGGWIDDPSPPADPDRTLPPPRPVGGAEPGGFAADRGP